MILEYVNLDARHSLMYNPQLMVSNHFSSNNYVFNQEEYSSRNEKADKIETLINVLNGHINNFVICEYGLLILINMIQNNCNQKSRLSTPIYMFQNSC